ncbi:MAG: tyrosine--tRNA ligase [Sulfolobales archaeon]|nr:tyrosine--tRNA ligase [Sulfolobales archaeon]MCX8209118.1 tyrosine--tRNA ligase [Sulfolobales archaeon]MDW8010197.1 tyrosine--tRNA ligase [Sulfolobales archaeon]
MDVESKLKLVLRDVEEIVTESELRELLETGGGRGYLGFEPSGLFHIGWLIWAYKFKELVDAGFRMVLLAATWHAWINDKLGGDLELIRAAAQHVVDVLNAIGLEGRFRVVYAEELVNSGGYWATLVRVAKSTSVARVRRALTIMGRRADEAESDFSKLVYPLMQVTDIFELDVDVALGGIDQRKAHMLARDVAEKLGRKKVVAVHTPLLPSLSGATRMDIASLPRDEAMAEIKMSKSKPESAIFLTDSDEEIRSKIARAYCPPREVEGNPVLGVARHLVFRGSEVEFPVDRPSKYGGPVTYLKYEDLEKDYASGRVHPADLKNSIAEYLVKKIVGPIRSYVLRAEREELLRKIASAITR